MKTQNFTTFGLALIATTLALSANLPAQTTTTYHGSGLNASGYCFDYDDLGQRYLSFGLSEVKQHVAGGAKDAYTYGYVYYSDYRYTDSRVEVCYGYADVTNQSISKGLQSGSASCALTLYCYSYDYETGEYSDWTEDSTLDILLTGVGSTTKSRYSYSYLDPSHFSTTYSSSGQSRQATSTFLIDGDPFTPSSNGYGYCQGNLSNSRWFSKTTINP